MEFLPCEAFDRANAIRAALPKEVQDEDEAAAQVNASLAEIIDIVHRLLIASGAEMPSRPPYADDVVVVGQQVQVRSATGAWQSGVSIGFVGATRAQSIVFDDKAQGAADVVPLGVHVMRPAPGNALVPEDRCLQLLQQAPALAAATFEVAIEVPSTLTAAKSKPLVRRESWLTATLLHVASWLGMPRLVEALLAAAGAPLAVCTRVVSLTHASTAGGTTIDVGERRQFADVTALHCAALAGHAAICARLIENAGAPLLRARATDAFVAYGDGSRAVLRSDVSAMCYAAANCDAAALAVFVNAGDRFAEPEESRQGVGAHGDERDVARLPFLRVMLAPALSSFGFISAARAMHTVAGPVATTDAALIASASTLLRAGARCTLPWREWRHGVAASYPGPAFDAEVGVFARAIGEAYLGASAALCRHLAAIALSAATAAHLHGVLQQLLVRPHAHRGDFASLPPAAMMCIWQHIVDVPFLEEFLLPGRLPCFVVTVPTPPQSLRAEADPDEPTSAILLQWTPPTFDGGSPITGYTVDQAGDYDFKRAVATVTVAPADTLRWRVARLTPGSQMHFRVRAHNEVGLSLGTKARGRVLNNAIIDAGPGKSS